MNTQPNHQHLQELKAKRAAVREMLAEQNRARDLYPNLNYEPGVVLLDPRPQLYQRLAAISREIAELQELLSAEVKEHEKQTQARQQQCLRRVRYYRATQESSALALSQAYSINTKSA